MGYTVLSLDLGSNLGWCLIKDNLIIESGVAPLNKGSIEANGMKFIRFSDWLNDFNGVDEIVFEDVRRFMSFMAARTWVGYFTILSMFSASTGIRLTGITTKAWKKIFTGNGNSKKIDVCATCLSMGWKNGVEATEVNNDEADAIGIAYAILASKGNIITF